MRRAALREGSEGYRVRALQSRLVELGYQLVVDGDFGPATRNQVLAFQADNGLTTDGIVGPQTEAKLDNASPRVERPDTGREDLTVSDLRERGSQTVKQAERVERSGWGALIFGGLWGAVESDGLLGAIPVVGGALAAAADTLRPLFDFVAENPIALLAVLGAGAAYLGWKIKQRRLHDAKTWRHVA